MLQSVEKIDRKILVKNSQKQKVLSQVKGYNGFDKLFTVSPTSTRGTRTLGSFKVELNYTFATTEGFYDYKPN